MAILKRPYLKIWVDQEGKSASDWWFRWPGAEYGARDFPDTALYAGGFCTEQAILERLCAID